MIIKWLAIAQMLVQDPVTLLVRVIPRQAHQVVVLIKHRHGAFESLRGQGGAQDGTLNHVAAGFEPRRLRDATACEM